MCLRVDDVIQGCVEVTMSDDVLVCVHVCRCPPHRLAWHRHRAMDVLYMLVGAMVRSVYVVYVWQTMLLRVWDQSCVRWVC